MFFKNILLNNSFFLIACTITPLCAMDINTAIYHYEVAANSRNTETFSAACDELLSAAHQATYADVSRAYQVARQKSPLHDHSLRAVATAGSLVVSEDIVPLVNTGLHALSYKGDNLFCFATNVLLGVHCIYNAFDVISSNKPASALVPAIIRGIVLYCNLEASKEKRTLGEQHDAVIRALMRILQEKNPQQYPEITISLNS